MKTLVFLFALFLSSTFSLAKSDPSTTLARASHDDIKMYRQPGTSTEVLKALKQTDEVVVVRKHNAHWSIVTVGEVVGYVLTSELRQAKAKPERATDRSGRKKIMALVVMEKGRLHIAGLFIEGLRSTLFTC